MQLVHRAMSDIDSVPALTRLTLPGSASRLLASLDPRFAAEGLLAQLDAAASRPSFVDLIPVSYASSLLNRVGHPAAEVALATLTVSSDRSVPVDDGLRRSGAAHLVEQQRGVARGTRIGGPCRARGHRCRPPWKIGGRCRDRSVDSVPGVSAATMDRPITKENRPWRSTCSSSITEAPRTPSTTCRWTSGHRRRSTPTSSSCGTSPTGWSGPANTSTVRPCPRTGCGSAPTAPANRPSPTARSPRRRI